MGEPVSEQSCCVGQIHRYASWGMMPDEVVRLIEQRGVVATWPAWLVENVMTGKRTRVSQQYLSEEMNEMEVLAWASK